MRLRAVLRPEAEEHELPPAEGRRHRRRTPRQAVSTVDPAGDEHVARIVGIGREDPPLELGSGK